jgi:hypothetical protein
MLHIIFIILFFFFLTFSQPAMKGTLCLHSRSQNKWLNLRILAHEITLWNSCSCFLFYPTSLPKYNALIKCLFSSEENYSKQKFRFDEKDISIIVGVGHSQLPHIIILANSTTVMITIQFYALFPKWFLILAFLIN